MGYKLVCIWQRVNEETRCSENKSTRLTLFACILKHVEGSLVRNKVQKASIQGYKP